MLSFQISQNLAAHFLNLSMKKWIDFFIDGRRCKRHGLELAEAKDSGRHCKVPASSNGKSLGCRRLLGENQMINERSALMKLKY